MKKYKRFVKRLSSRVLVSIVLVVTVSLVLGTNLTVLASESPHETEWEKTFGEAGMDRAYSVQQTTDGGYVIAGYTDSYDGGDFYLVKTDSSGVEEWYKTYGGADYEEAYDVQQTDDGGYILCGMTASFEVDCEDAYLVKTDSSGNIIWQQTYGGTGYDGAYSVQQTADGGYIIAGYIESYDGDDFYLVKTDALGNMTWQQTYGGTGYDGAYSIQPTDGGYIIAGYTASFGVDCEDAYLVKTDASGNMTWQNTFGGTGYDGASSVQQTTDGGYVIAGYTDSYGGGDFYLVKTDALGNMTWQQTYGGADYEEAYDVQQTDDGGYILCGMTASFGAGGVDGYLVKIDASGNIEWDETLGGTNYDAVGSVYQATDGGYIAAGYTNSYGAVGSDVYLVKVSSGINTPVGEDVTVNLSNGTVTFPTVSGNGTTTMSTLTENPVDPTPSDFYVMGENFVEITTTASYSGVITVGIMYDDSGIPDEESLHLFHYSDTAWEDVTTYVDTVNNIIYAQVDSLSPFFIGLRVANANGPYLVQVGNSLVLDGVGSYHPGGDQLSYDWDFGDNTTGYGVLTIHTYTAVGIYDVELIVTDESDIQSSDTTMAVVYDPETGSASGGGWFWFDQGNLKGHPESEGKATFGFVAKYRHDAAEGHLGFRYHAGDINLRSGEISWLVISGVSAQFQGEGTINGEGLYTFRVLAKDGDQAGGQPDQFTIKIWEGTDTAAEPIYKTLHAELGGGNIIIHDN